MNELTIFGLERLEDRLLLAVNITQNGGNLIITGDGNDEIIHLTDDGGGVRVRVDEDGGGVDIDETYFGVVNITINTNGGEDYVAASDLNLDGNLTINTGADDDVAYLGYEADAFGSGYYGYVDIGGKVTIITGDGYDDVTIDATDVGKDLSINSGDQDDTVILFADLGNTYVGGQTSIDSSAGDDIVALAAYNGYDLELHSNLTINTADGEDIVAIGDEDGDVSVGGHTSISTGAADDIIVIYGNYDYAVVLNKNLTINTAGGEDIVVIGGEDGDTSIGGNTKIDTGADDDIVDLSDTVFDGKLDIFTHGGEDIVAIEADGGAFTATGNVRIETGADDDIVSFAAGGGENLNLDGHLHVTTAGGEDIVAFDAESGDINVGGNAKFDLGNDNDIFFAEGTGSGYDVDFFGNLDILAGNGDDIVAFEDDVSVFGNTKVNLGGGEDVFDAEGSSTDADVEFFGKFDLKAEGADDVVVAAEYVSFYDNASFDGGGGYDILVIEDATFFDNVKIKNFELVVD